MTMKRSERKKRTSWIDVIFTTIICTLVITSGVMIFLSLNKETPPTPEVKKSATEVPTTIDTIDSNYPGIKIVTETSNDPYAPFAIQYPQSLHKLFNEAISTYIQQAKQIYLTTMEENKQNKIESPGELNISFETFPHYSGSYSLVLVNTSYSGGASGTTEIRSFHLNPDTGKTITIQDIFEQDEKHLEQLANAVQEKLFADPAISDTILPVEAALYTAPDWNNFTNFAITDEEIIFYFEENKIAADSAGVPIVSIPLADLHTMLAADFKLIEKDIAQPPIETAPDNAGTDEDQTNTNVDSESTSPENEMESPSQPTEKRVALTFDDGPDPKVTMQILEILAKYDAKATFFMLGSRVEYYPEIAKSVGDAGHELANHSWNHPDLTKLGSEKVWNEIHNTTAIIESVTGKKMTGGFRPPYGAVNQNVRAQTDLPVVLWDVDTLDWKHRDPTQLLTYVKNQTKDGSIILMHDIHQSTADGLNAVLAYLSEEGYTFVPVSELN